MINILIEIFILAIVAVWYPLSVALIVYGLIQTADMLRDAINNYNKSK